MSDETDLNVNIGANPAGIEAGARRAKSAVETVAKGTEGLDAAFKRLKQSIDPTFAAQEKYNKELADSKRLLDAGRISQSEYAAGVAAAKAALDAQVSSIQRNSAAAKAAAAAVQQQVAQEAASRAFLAQLTAEVAQKTAAIAAKTTADLKKENTLRRIDEQVQIQQVVAAARAAATARVAAEREAAQAAGQTPATKAGERASINAAVAAARASAKEIAAASKQADIEELASARELAEEKKRLATEAAAVAVAAARERAAAEAEANAAVKAAGDASRTEAIKAAKDATKLAAGASAEAARSLKAEATAAREAAAAVAAHAAEERKAAEAAVQLRASIDPKFAAQERYNQTMRTATQLLMQNSLKQGEWIAIQKQARAQMDLNARSMGRMNSVYVQMGYQAQDVTASLASGISPLVILAQQGGQTAAALSMMGGTVGRVAAFFAGPWGAAIIGATLLLGLFIGQNKKAKDSTIDVLDAESRRTAKLEKLTEALEKYVKAQKEANASTTESHGLSQQAMIDATAENEMKVAGVKQKLEDAKANLDATMKMPGDQSGAITYWTLKVASLEKQLKGLKTQAEETNAALHETQITRANDQAEAQVDPMKKIALKYDQERALLQNKFRVGAIDETKLQSELVRVLKEKKDAEEAYQKSKKLNNAFEGKETAEFGMPVNGPITSGFGKREAIKTANGNMSSTQHAGIDIGAAKGTAISAPQVGVVKSVGYSPTLGKYVVIDHGSGTTTRFGHMDSTNVEAGERVTKGQKIGTVGSTGNATGPHLHYEIRVNNKAVDPTKQHVLPVDALEADQKVAKDVFEEYIADLGEQQTAADENYNEILRLQDLKIKATIDYYGEDSKEASDANKERLQLERKFQAQLVEEKRRGIEMARRVGESKENTAYNVQSSQQGMKEDDLSADDQGGIGTDRQRLERHRQMLEEEYQADTVHEEKLYQLKVRSIQDQLALENLPKKVRDDLNAQIEEAQAQHNSRLEEMEAQHQRAMGVVQRQQTDLSLKNWQEMTDIMRSSMQSAVVAINTHTLNLKQGLISMADQILYKFADIGLQMVQKWAMAQIKMRIIHAASQHAQTAATATGVAARQTIENVGFFSWIIGKLAAMLGIHVGTEAAKTSATAAGAVTRVIANKAETIAMVGSAAAIAGANGVASWALAPWPIDLGAPAFGMAMASAAAGFGALASAEGGWGEVPKDGVKTELHKKEMVLPAKFAVPLREMLTSRTSSGLYGAAVAAGESTRAGAQNNTHGGNKFYYQPTHHYSNMDAETMLTRDGASMRKWFNNQVRNGSLKVR